VSPSEVANDVKLKSLLVDVLLIEEEQYRDDYGPDQIASWDSLGMIEIAAAIHEHFGETLEPEEMVALRSIGDIKAVLRQRGVDFPG
jgi:acyl carrier protein